MRGTTRSRRLDESIAVSPETLAPQNNVYRDLGATLDLSFVQEWVHALYAERGRPSIDPVVFFGLHLVMFFEGIRSERKLLATVSLNLPLHRCLGYACDRSTSGRPAM